MIDPVLTSMAPSPSTPAGGEPLAGMGELPSAGGNLKWARTWSNLSQQVQEGMNPSTLDKLNLEARNPLDIRDVMGMYRDLAKMSQQINDAIVKVQMVVHLTTSTAQSADKLLKQQ